MFKKKFQKQITETNASKKNFNKNSQFFSSKKQISWQKCSQKMVLKKISPQKNILKKNFWKKFHKKKFPEKKCWKKSQKKWAQRALPFAAKGCSPSAGATKKAPEVRLFF